MGNPAIGKTGGSRKMKRCVIFGGGEITDLSYIKSILRPEDDIICADRGYAYCLSMNIKPNLILGDFDSYQEELTADCEIMRYPIEKDDTDTMLAVKEAIRRDCGEIVMVGMLGGRIDHTFANIQTLVFAAKHGVRTSIEDRSCYIAAVSGGQELTIPYEKGYHFSVFCHSDNASGVSIHHAKYEVTDADLTNSFPIGVSNDFIKGEDASVSVKEGILIIVKNQGE